MPSSAPHVCACGSTIPPCSTCACKRRQKQARDQRYDRKRPHSSKRGYDRRWMKARLKYLREYPMCVMCGFPATVVDHIFPHKGDQSLFWNETNWQALCGTCHNSHKQRQELREKVGK